MMQSFTIAGYSLTEFISFHPIHSAVSFQDALQRKVNACTPFLQKGDRNDGIEVIIWVSRFFFYTENHSISPSVVLPRE